MNLIQITALHAERDDETGRPLDVPRLIANAGRGFVSDEQRKAVMAKMRGGGGSSPRASRWYDGDVLRAAGRGFFEGANDAAEKGLAKLSFGLTDKIGFTDSTRPELQWSGYDAADQNAELARTALITALGLKAGSAAWSTWRARQAAAAAAGAGSRKFTSTGQDFWNNPGAWKSQNLAAKLEASQEKLIRKALTHGVDKNEAAYIREMLWDKKDLFRNPAGGGPVEWRDVASAYGFDGPRLDAALRVIEQGARPASSNPLGTLAAREAQLLQRAANMGRAIRGSAMPYTLTPADKSAVNAMVRDPRSRQYLQNLVEDNAHILRAPSGKLDYAATQRFIQDVIGESQRIDVSSMPQAPLSVIRAAEMAGRGQMTADFLRTSASQPAIAARSEYISRLVPLDAADIIEPLAKGSGGARLDLLNKWSDFADRGLPNWEIVQMLGRNIGNRSASLVLVANAVRVAVTPDEVLANRPRGGLSDTQRKAIFAKSRGGGTSRGAPKSDSVIQSLPVARGGPPSSGSFPETPAWNKWKQDVVNATTRAGGGSYTDATGFHAADGTHIPFPQRPARPQVPPVAAPFAGIPQMPLQDGMMYAGGNPYYDERLGRDLTPQEKAAKSAQLAGFLSKAYAISSGGQSSGRYFSNARRPLTDKQKRAIFAKGGGGHSAAAVSGVPSPYAGHTPTHINPNTPPQVLDAMRAAASQQVPAYDAAGNPLNLAGQFQSQPSQTVSSPVVIVPGNAPAGSLPEQNPNAHDPAGPGIASAVAASRPTTGYKPPLPQSPVQPTEQPAIVTETTLPQVQTQSVISGTPHWSVPGYGDPALPTRKASSENEMPIKKLPRITPEMLNRLRKRLAGG